MKRVGHTQLAPSVITAVFALACEKTTEGRESGLLVTAHRPDFQNRCRL
jgi:hypothetical protein